MEWFKFYGGAYLSDPKMLMLTACERSCWLTLLSFASVAENNGVVKYLSEPQLMTAAGVSPMHEEWDATVGVLAKFDGLGMISLEKTGEIQVLNWAKRQESYLSNAERQKQYRERVKERATTVVTPLQQRNARIEENRIDTSATREFDVVEEAPKDKKNTPEMLSLYEVFSHNPARAVWKTRVHEREAAKVLLKEYGYDECAKRYKISQEHKKEHMCPQFDSPSDMLTKMVKMETFLNNL